MGLLIRDLTEQKAIELERKKTSAEAIHTEKMLLLGELASHVAHEINNPLAVIQARISLLQEAVTSLNSPIPKELQQDFSQKLTSTEKNATRIERIVKSLYRFSRNESQEEVQAASVSDLITQTWDLCSTRFKNHGVDLISENISDSVFVLCRPLQLSQILLNLLNNAFDAVGEHTQPGEPDRWVKVTIANADSHIAIKISNGGKRIPKEIEKKVFDAYFTTKPVGQGTGLGLSISQALAKSNGGDLFIDEKSENTCFVCTVPLAINKSNPQATA